MSRAVPEVTLATMLPMVWQALGRLRSLPGPGGAFTRITQPSEIVLYLKAFEQLHGMAVYGAQARALIVKAIDALH
ncbi:hypothetical protein ABZ446_34035 [Streptomyces sp. NPDC005813]|uniref:hypothetical protein n=1 Tax=Streptomyces sp. NPDC005813 TaxID=3155592 RepID=UPI0033D79BC6